MVDGFERITVRQPGQATPKLSVSEVNYFEANGFVQIIYPNNEAKTISQEEFNANYDIVAPK